LITIGVLDAAVGLISSKDPVDYFRDPIGKSQEFPPPTFWLSESGCREC